MHPTINTWWAEIHQVEIQQEAAKHRAQAAARPCQPGLRERLSLRIGSLLITAGQHVRAPYESALDQQPRSYGPGC